MRPEDIVFAPVFLPLLGAATAFCAKAFLKGRAAKTIEYAGVFVGLALPWAVFIYTLPLVLAGQAVTGVVGSWYAGVGIQYRFDGLAWLVNMLGFSVGAAAWIYSLGGGPRGPAFSAVFLIQTAALAATIMTADLFNLFVALEVMGIASYVLVASSDKPGASLASFSYLMVSAAAMVFFLIGLYGIYRLTGSLSYTGIAAALTALPGQRYEYCNWKETRVAFNYHVEYKRFYYSVDYGYANHSCTVRVTKDTTEIFIGGERVASSFSLYIMV